MLGLTLTMGGTTMTLKFLWDFIRSIYVAVQRGS